MSDIAPLPLLPDIPVAAPSSVHIPARSDIEAVGQWLSEYRHNPRTFRHYRKEAERLLLWLDTQSITLQTMDRRHLDAFETFLSDPQPARQWVGSVTRRDSPHWRPFRGPLSPASRRQSLVILQGMFNWLREAGWVAHNPFALMRNKQRRMENRTATVERYLERPVWEWFWQWLQQPPRQHRPSSHYAAERRRFAVGFAYLLAPRLSEMSAACMGDFIEREGRWWWCVTGKGDKHARLPVSPTLLTLLTRWRLHLDLPARPDERETTPLLRALDRCSPITDNQLYRILKHTFQEAADALAQQEGDTPHVRALRQATPHWLRHTALTHQAQSGVELRYLAQTARHARLDTTARYLHTEAEEWHEQLASHGNALCTSSPLPVDED